STQLVGERLSENSGPQSSRFSLTGKFGTFLGRRPSHFAQKRVGEFSAHFFVFWMRWSLLLSIRALPNHMHQDNRSVSKDRGGDKPTSCTSLSLSKRYRVNSGLDTLTPILTIL